MAQEMPVVRQIRWIGLVQQAFAIAALSFAFHFAFPGVDAARSLFAGALVYLIFCRAMRFVFTREHRTGIAAYRARKFHDAIPHFEASYRFFSAHPRIEAWRYLLFATAGPNRYRTMAL